MQIQCRQMNESSMYTGFAYFHLMCVRCLKFNAPCTFTNSSSLKKTVIPSGVIELWFKQVAMFYSLYLSYEFKTRVCNRLSGVLFSPKKTRTGSIILFTCTFKLLKNL